MGPITKKINEYMSTEGISEETIQVLENLKKEIHPIEKQVINHSYYQGYSDKEMNRRPIWGHYEHKYECGILRMVGKYSK